MKPFDLHAALAGEPVRLRGGYKAHVIGKIPNNLTYDDNEPIDYPLVGIVLDENGYLTDAEVHWTINGSGYKEDNPHDSDIIGMWEDVIDLKDLPKAFMPKKGETYYYIHPHETNFYLDIHETTCNNCRFDEILSDTGNCFRTREDVQKWLNFMESMKE